MGEPLAESTEKQPSRAESIATAVKDLGGLDALARVGDTRDQIVAFTAVVGGVSAAARLLRVPRSALVGYVAGGKVRRGTVVMVEMFWRHHVLEGKP